MISDVNHSVLFNGLDVMFQLLHFGLQTLFPVAQESRNNERGCGVWFDGVGVFVT